MKKILITLCFALTASVSFAQNSETKVIEPQVYQAHLAESPTQFVDVRTPQEYGEGHIEGAENIDFLAEGFLLKMQKFDKNEPLYIYCRSGNRSQKAAAQLSEAGFRNIIDLKGGYKAWQELEKE